MDCPWKRTLASVFLVLSLSNVRVLSQNVVPTGALSPLPLLREPLKDCRGSSPVLDPQQMNLLPVAPNGIQSEFIPLIPCPLENQQIRPPIFQNAAMQPIASEVPPIGPIYPQLLPCNSIPEANLGTNLGDNVNELSNANLQRPSTQRPAAFNVPLITNLPPPRLNILPNSFAPIPQNLNVQSISNLPPPTGPPPNFSPVSSIPIQPGAACDIPPSNFALSQMPPYNIPQVPLVPIPQGPIFPMIPSPNIAPVPLVPMAPGPTYNIPLDNVLSQPPSPNFLPVPSIPVQQAPFFNPINISPIPNLPPSVPIIQDPTCSIPPNNFPINQAPLPNLQPLVPFSQSLPFNIPPNSIQMTQGPTGNMPLSPVIPILQDPTCNILANNGPIFQAPQPNILPVPLLPFPQGPLLNIPPYNAPFIQELPPNISPIPFAPFLPDPTYNIQPTNVQITQGPPSNIPPPPLVPIQQGPIFNVPPISNLPPSQAPLNYSPIPLVPTNPFNIPPNNFPFPQALPSNTQLVPLESIANGPSIATPQVPTAQNLPPTAINLPPVNSGPQNQNMQIFPLVPTSYPQPYLQPPNVPPPCTLTTDLTSVHFVQPPILPPPSPVQNYPSNNPNLIQPVAFPQSISAPLLPENIPSPNIQISGLPPVLPTLNAPLTCNDPREINLQINVPPPIMPEPKITIITAFPSPPESPVVTTDTPDLSFGMYSPYPMPPIIIDGSRRSKSWLPLFLVALFARDGYYEGDGGSCCSCNNNEDIPIPFPIPIPTNNPIILGNRKGASSR